MTVDFEGSIVTQDTSVTQGSGPSSTSQNDNWCHVQSTITMLYLAVCQIESSMKESGKSVDQLTQSFTELAQHSREVDQHIQKLDDITEIQAFKEEVSNTVKEMQEKINEAITAFQFYDRISQRLDHVSNSLEGVSELMSNSQERNSPSAWESIKDKVKNNYTMESERLMFEHIIRGASVKEALDIYQHHFSHEEIIEEENGDEIELF